MPYPQRPDRLRGSTSVVLNAYLAFFRRLGWGIWTAGPWSWPLAPSRAEVKNEFSCIVIPLCVHVVQRGNTVFSKRCDACILSDIDNDESGNQTGSVNNFVSIRRCEGRTLF